MEEPSTKSLSVSPNRFGFALEQEHQRIPTYSGSESANPHALMVEYYEQLQQRHRAQAENAEIDPNNLEHVLRSTPWILNKVRNSRVYAQNLYAAMCNRDFQRKEVLPILKNETWSCSWRSAGGIVADMRQEGDYIDWYCSGIRGNPADDPDTAETSGYVGESIVTDEIREDLARLGWMILD